MRARGRAHSCHGRPPRHHLCVVPGEFPFMQEGVCACGRGEGLTASGWTASGTAVSSRPLPVRSLLLPASLTCTLQNSHLREPSRTVLFQGLVLSASGSGNAERKDSRADWPPYMCSHSGRVSAHPLCHLTASGECRAVGAPDPCGSKERWSAEIRLGERKGSRALPGAAPSYGPGLLLGCHFSSTQGHNHLLPSHDFVMALMLSARPIHLFSLLSLKPPKLGSKMRGSSLC